MIRVHEYLVVMELKVVMDIQGMAGDSYLLAIQLVCQVVLFHYQAVTIIGLIVS